MTAAVLPFKGEPDGPIFEASPATFRAQQEAVRDARLIREAHRQNSDWTAQLLVALVSVLDERQLLRAEARLDNSESEDALQAIAVLRLASGDKEHKQRVRAALGGQFQ